VYFGVLDCVFSVFLIATFYRVRGCCLGQSELDEIFFRVSMILLKTRQVSGIFGFAVICYHKYDSEHAECDESDKLVGSEILSIVIVQTGEFGNQDLKLFSKIASDRCNTKSKLRLICLVLHRKLIFFR
jgi:hypothetical protein